MSLIKLAIGIIPFIPTGFSSFAAKSGQPFNYFTRKTSSNAITKKLQKSTLAGLANLEAEMRKGRVADSTKMFSSVADSYMGHGGALATTMLQNARNTKGPKGALINKLLTEAIDNEGRYNIGNIEHRLKQSKKLYDYAEKIKKTPVTTIGLVSGAAVGYNNGEEGHKLKSTLKGTVKGGLIGGSLRKGMNIVTNHNIYKSIPKMHKSYFEDNYWKSQLEAANTGIYRKIGQGIGKTLTSTPGKRLARIESFEAFNNLKDTNVTDLKGIYKNTKTFGKAFGNSFKSEDYLKQKYGV